MDDRGLLLRKSLRVAVISAAMLGVARGNAASQDSGQQRELHAKSGVEERGGLAEAELKWIAAKTGWRQISVPEIRTKTSAELSTMFFGDPEGIDGIRPLALYARDEHILYISDALKFDNLADRSILLHELVHHLQVANGAQSTCREAAEAQAYGLQIQWLREQGIENPVKLLGLSEIDLMSLGCP